MKDGTVREFVERGRPGGSFSNSIKYETGFVVIKDEWGERTSIPTEDIREIKEDAPRSW